MKVCFVVGTLARGGAEKQLVFMLRALRRAGIAAEVLCLTRGEDYEAEILDSGFEIKWVGEPQNQAARLWKIVKALRATRADIVQSSHFYTNIYAGAAARLLKIPGVGAVRSDLTYELKSHRITGAWQISLPHFLIVNSDAARRRLHERGVAPRRIEFVRNVVEIEEDAMHSSSDAPLKILFAGRLDRNKRPERFVRLAAILTARFPHRALQFQIAGDGELRSALENLASKWQLTPDRLKFLGACGAMPEIYRQADVLISTSEREGTPNVVLEAMAHSLPIVATGVGGTTEILDESRGILVAPGDEEALIAATVELISDANLRHRLGSAGRRYVAQNHSLDYLQKNLTEIYRKLLPAICETSQAVQVKTSSL